MTLKIAINMGNAAFEHQGAEVARMLRGIAKTVEDDENLRSFDTPIVDVNGKLVGQAKVSKP